MSPLVKSILLVPLPLSHLAGARAPISHLQTSFPELGVARPSVSGAFAPSVAPSVEVEGGGSGVPHSAAEEAAAAGQSCSFTDSALRTAFDRADSTLSDVRTLLSSREVDLQRSQEESAF
ncbi:uncharacterized protein SCHCODRAFT_02704938 [Schizophyllum commune H4-8]|nr:uncharacterized protein SCHCODRAFT_02704938 [Schizophyllum commune H4-8]KAI5887577.1 hypothetical protein SCHCODRAFT_02704938 [Schizophyllum commune H4-8]